MGDETIKGPLKLWFIQINVTIDYSYRFQRLESFSSPTGFPLFTGQIGFQQRTA